MIWSGIRTGTRLWIITRLRAPIERTRMPTMTRIAGLRKFRRPSSRSRISKVTHRYYAKGNCDIKGELSFNYYG
jgi:hypothetical protein